MTLLLGFVAVSDTHTCVPLSNQAIAWQRNLGFLDTGGGPDCLVLIIVIGLMAAAANLQQRDQDLLIWHEWKITAHLKA